MFVRFLSFVHACVFIVSVFVHDPVHQCVIVCMKHECVSMWMLLYVYPYVFNVDVRNVYWDMPEVY